MTNRTERSSISAPTVSSAHDGCVAAQSGTASAEAASLFLDQKNTSVVNQPKTSEATQCKASLHEAFSALSSTAWNASSAERLMMDYVALSNTPSSLPSALSCDDSENIVCRHAQSPSQRSVAAGVPTKAESAEQQALKKDQPLSASFEQSSVSSLCSHCIGIQDRRLRIQNVMRMLINSCKEIEEVIHCHFQADTCICYPNCIVKGDPICDLFRRIEFPASLHSELLEHLLRTVRPSSNEEVRGLVHSRMVRHPNGTSKVLIPITVDRVTNRAVKLGYTRCYGHEFSPEADPNAAAAAAPSALTTSMLKHSDKLTDAEILPFTDKQRYRVIEVVVDYDPPTEFTPVSYRGRMSQLRSRAGFRCTRSPPTLDSSPASLASRGQSSDMTLPLRRSVSTVPYSPGTSTDQLETSERLASLAQEEENAVVATALRWLQEGDVGSASCEYLSKLEQLGDSSSDACIYIDPASTSVGCTSTWFSGGSGQPRGATRSPAAVPPRINLSAGCNLNCGARAQMEDRAVVVMDLHDLCQLPPLPNGEKAYFFAIYDGHGGSEVVDYVAASFHHDFAASEEYRRGEVEDAFCKTFQAVDAKLAEKLQVLVNTKKQYDLWVSVGEVMRNAESAASLPCDNAVAAAQRVVESRNDVKETPVEQVLTPAVNGASVTAGSLNCGNSITHHANADAERGATQTNSGSSNKLSGSVDEIDKSVAALNDEIRNLRATIAPDVLSQCPPKSLLDLLERLPTAWEFDGQNNFKALEEPVSDYDAESPVQNVNTGRQMARVLTSGSTASIVFIKGSTLYIANLGDSRCVLSRGGRVACLTEDHRIRSSGREIQRVGETPGTYMYDGYLFGQLAVTRAFGNVDHDSGAKLPGLTSTPDVIRIELREDDDFLIIGCDGLFDWMTPIDAAVTVREALEKTSDPTFASEQLVKQAIEISQDNISVIVVAFHPERYRQEVSETTCPSATSTAQPLNRDNLITPGERIGFRSCSEGDRSPSDSESSRNKALHAGFRMSSTTMIDYPGDLHRQPACCSLCHCKRASDIQKDDGTSTDHPSSSSVRTAPSSYVKKRFLWRVVEAP